MAKKFPVAHGQWYRLHIDGKPPLMCRFARASVRDDRPFGMATLRIELRLTDRAADDFDDPDTYFLLTEFQLELSKSPEE